MNFAVAFAIAFIIALYIVAEWSQFYKDVMSIFLTIFIQYVKISSWLHFFLLKVEFQVLALYDGYIRRAKDRRWLELKRRSNIVLEMSSLQERHLDFLCNILNISEEKRRKIMLVVVKSESKVKYTPVTYRGKADAPVFIMERTSLTDRAKVNDQVLIEMEEDRSAVKNINFNQASLRLVVEQFKGWENVVTEDGTPVLFEDALDALEMLPDDVQSELVAVFGKGYIDLESEAKAIEAHDKKLQKEAEEAAAKAKAEAAAKAEAEATEAVAA